MTKKKKTPTTTTATSEAPVATTTPDPRPADGFVRTFSGARLYLRREHMQHSDPFPLEDIARGLEREPRWSGQTTEPYTVAQHSVAVGLVAAWHPEPLTDSDDCGPIAVPQRPMSHRVRTLVGGLIHDAHEAVLRDLPKPVKALLGPGVAQLEELVDGYVLRAVDNLERRPFFDDAVGRALVKWADKAVMVAERYLFRPADGVGLAIVDPWILQVVWATHRYGNGAWLPMLRASLAHGSVSSMLERALPELGRLSSADDTARFGRRPSRIVWRRMRGLVVDGVDAHVIPGWFAFDADAQETGYLLSATKPRTDMLGFAPSQVTIERPAKGGAA